MLNVYGRYFSRGTNKRIYTESRAASVNFNRMTKTRRVQLIKG